MSAPADTIYLDHNATTPLCPEALEAMLPYLRHEHGNPSSVHRLGQQARRAIDAARQQVAALIGAREDEVRFTSGGTEADNLALVGALALREPERDRLVTSAIEHPAVLATCDALAAGGVEVERLPVGGDGLLDLGSAGQAIGARTALASLMLANNDVGTVQPLRELAELARAHGALVHSDAVQAAGKVPVDVDRLGVDLLALSAHKLYGPKGVGALFVRRGVSLAPLLHGGGQERGLRPGTENVAAIVGFGRACELAAARLAEEAGRLGTLRDQLQRRLCRELDGVTVNGHPERRLPNTLSVSFDGVDGAALLMSLDLAGVAVSTGASCSALSVAPPHTLTAMGIPRERALATLRISLGHDNDQRAVERAAELLVAEVRRLRALTRGAA